MKSTEVSRAGLSKQLAHDLLNQLSVIVGNCDLLTEKIVGEGEPVNDMKLPDPNCMLYLQRISEAASSMTSKVRDTLRENNHRRGTRRQKH